MKLLSTIDGLQSKPPRDIQTSVNSVGGRGSGVEFVVYVNPTPSSLLSPLLCLCPPPFFFSRLTFQNHQWLQRENKQICSHETNTPL